MMRSLPGVMRWVLALGHKCLRVVPGATLLVVAATLVAQVALVVAFFLPLKVLILLGADEVPPYFPSLLSTLQRDQLVVGLSAAAGVAYALHLLAHRVIAWGAQRGTQGILAHSQKIVLFENQREIVANAYQRYSRAAAGAAFVGLALLSLAWLYPLLAGAAIAYATIAAVGLVGVCMVVPMVHDRVAKNLSAAAHGISGVGFLLLFALIVADFLYATPPGLVAALVSLLLIRQTLNRAAGSVGDIAALHSQRLRLDALFFHNRILPSSTTPAGSGVWHFLVTASLSQWLEPLLAQAGADRPAVERAYWLQTGTPGIATFAIPTGEDGPERVVRLFDSNKQALAQHEAVLLSQAPPGLPAPSLEMTTALASFHCHVVRLDARIERITAASLSANAAELRADLCAVEPAPALIERYRRSRPLLGQQFDGDLLRRLERAAGCEQKPACDALRAHLAAVQCHLKALPLTLVNPDINADTIVRAGPDRRPRLLHWSRWTLEPLGAGWPVDARQLAGLADALAARADRRPALTARVIAGAELGALAYAFDRECARERYTSALELVPRMIDVLNHSGLVDASPEPSA